MVTHNITFSRDNLIQLVLKKDFYEANPTLKPLEQTLNDCIKAFRDSGRKAGCGCRADTKLLVGCLTELLKKLDEIQAQSQEEINKFILYATRVPIRNEGDKIKLSVFFRTSKENDAVLKHEYIYQ